MSKDLHGFKGGGFAMLTHNVLDAFGEPGIIVVAEDTVILTGADGKMVELDIILDNVLVVLHFEVVNSIFCISSRINGAKLDAEGLELGVSSESRIDGSKYSRVVPQRQDRAKVTFSSSSK